MAKNRQIWPFGDSRIAIWLQKIAKVSDLKKYFWQYCRARTQYNSSIQVTKLNRIQKLCLFQRFAFFNHYGAI